MKKIILQTIPHKQQRYKTVGDWYEWKETFTEEEIIVIRTSALVDPRREFLILVHELVEWGLCHFAGISQEKVDLFDMAREDDQNEVELGDLAEAPYRRQHCLATAVERILAAELDVVWNDYEEELLDLS